MNAKVYIATALGIYIAFASSSSHAVAACGVKPDCVKLAFDESNLPPSFPEGFVHVTLVNPPSNNAGNLAVAAANALSQDAGMNITYSTAPQPGRPVLTIVFDTTTTHPTCGGVSNIAGCTDYGAVSPDGTVQAATSTIYLAAQAFGTTPIWDPTNLAAYLAGVIGVALHEISHTEGIPDAKNAGDVMSSLVIPNNQTGVTNWSPCDSIELRRAKNKRTTGRILPLCRTPMS